MPEVQSVGKEQFDEIFHTLFLEKPAGHSDDTLVGIYLSKNHRYLEFEGKDGERSFIEYKAEA